MKKEIEINDADMDLRSAKTKAKVHRSFIKNGATYSVEDTINGTPESVKEQSQPIHKGEKVEIEHVHTTRVFDKEYHFPTNNGIVKRRIEKVVQTYDFGDGKNPTSQNNPTESKKLYANDFLNEDDEDEEQPTKTKDLTGLQVLKNFVDNLAMDIRQIRDHNVVMWVMIACALVLGASAFVVMVLK